MSGWNTLPPENPMFTPDNPVLTEDPPLAADAGGELDDAGERTDLAAYRLARRRARLRRLGTGALGLAILAALWQAAAMIIRDPVFLPSVTQTASSFVHYFGHPYPAQGSPLWADALTSLRRILIGFAAGTLIGVTLGAGMSANRVVRHLVDPVIEVLRRCRRWPSSRCSSSGWGSARCPKRC